MNSQARDLDISSLPSPFHHWSTKIIVRISVLSAILKISVISVAVYIIKMIKKKKKRRSRVMRVSIRPIGIPTKTSQSNERIR